MNIVAVSLHNTSTDLDFKSDDNCVSPLGQTGRGQATIKFTVTATWTPNRSISLTPWPRREILYFSSLNSFFLIGIFVSHLLARIYADYIIPVRLGMSFITVTMFMTTYQFILQPTNPCLYNLICLPEAYILASTNRK